MSVTPPRDRARIYSWLGLAILAVIWLAMLLFGTGTLDQQLCRLLYAGGSPVLVKLAKLATRLGEPNTLVIGGVVVGLALLLTRQRPLAISLILVFLGGRGLTEVQKEAVGRIRPALEPHLVSARTFSFVSGHAGNSMIVFLALALALVPKGPLRAAAVALAILLSLAVGLSRVMLGVHWPSDVVGGWAFGAFWVLVVLRPMERLLHVPLKR